MLSFSREISDVVLSTLRFQVCLFSLVFLGMKQGYSKEIFPEDQHARVQIYSLSLIFRMWNLPHYRSVSFQADLLANLSNVAIPGTGIPLSVFCRFKVTAILLVFIINPFICFIAAINKANKAKYSNIKFYLSAICKFYMQHLLHPDDWFSLWSLNCRLTSLHSLTTNSPGFKQEDKWTFLIDGERLGVPVTPFDRTMEAIVVKNKNIEGGMGIHFYKNAAFEGDWIIQKKIKNAAWLNNLLPTNPPLSTMRVITTSTWSLNREWQPTNVIQDDPRIEEYVSALSSVLRLGRANASTDHSSILFDVNISTGEIKSGNINSHWYKLGLPAVRNCSWLPEGTFTSHPDAPYPQVSGEFVPDISSAVRIVKSAHFTMMADVPIVGWDVAFTEEGIQLLEVNLSCNFFRGSFDLKAYISFVESFFVKLDL